LTRYSNQKQVHRNSKVNYVVAVVGATDKEGSVGRNVLWNLVRSPFGGTIFPVNLTRKNVMGILAYPTISSIPEKVDLAVICIQAKFVPDIIKECVKCGVGAAVIISAGFAEAGEQGKIWFKEIQQTAKQGNLKIIGPNCLGVMSPKIGFNGSFASGIPAGGTVGVISQSGALGTAIVDWAIKENVGFSRFASIGSMADVGWSDLLEYYGRDPETKSIVLYMEGIGDARSFMSSARNVALKKPIVVIKAGSTEEGKSATASHTGSLAGSDEVIDTVFKRCGVLRVQTIQELFLTAEVLAKQPRPKGKHLCIITNAGGPACIATDALVRNGGKLAKLSKDTIDKLDKVLPPHWSRGNPVDVLGDANASLYVKALDICAQDPNVDGMLVILTPQSMSEPTKTAEAITTFTMSFTEKPILSSWMGGTQVDHGRKVLSRANIPTFEYPDTAAKIFNYMWQYSKWQPQLCHSLIFQLRGEPKQICYLKKFKILEEDYCQSMSQRNYLECTTSQLLLCILHQLLMMRSKQQKKLDILLY
jgi:acetyltransferase